MQRHRFRRLVLGLPVLGLLAAGSGRAVVVPLGAEFQISVQTAGTQSRPSVATGADGRVFIVWSRTAGGDSQNGLIGRLYDAGSGTFASGEIRLADGATSDPKVVAEPGGGYWVAWVDGAQVVRARRCGADGQPAGPAILASFGLADPGTLDVAVSPSGGHIVISAWATPLPPFQTYIYADALDAADQLLSHHPVWPGLFQVFAVHPRVVAQPGGGFVLAWVNARAPSEDVWAEHLDPTGLPLDEAFQVNDSFPAARTRPSVVVEDGGGCAVVWRTLGAGPAADGIWVQRFDAADARRGDVLRLTAAADLADVADAAPTVVNAPGGRRLVLWADRSDAVDPPGLPDAPLVLGRFFDASWQPVGSPFQVNGNPLASDQEAAASFVPGGGFLAAWSAFGIAGRRFSADCPGGAGSLCLNGDRFLASVAWHDPRTNARGTATALPLTADSGAFWFFSAGNAELLVKVLDGRAVNGHWWVFFGALTDLEFDLTVTDSLTGAKQVYHNPPYTLASRADINAFSDPAPPAPRPAAPSTPLRAEGLCPAGAACLGAFQVTVEWIDPFTGQAHQASGVPLSDNSATFWFFAADNIELIVKVLDGRAVNGHYWFFYGALTDVEYTIRVDWIDGHQTRTYHNPHGHMASHADTNAF